MTWACPFSAASVFALYWHDGLSLDQILIKQADTAMYRIKDRGRGSYGFYQPQMNANLLISHEAE